MTSVTWPISKNSNQVTKVLETKIDSGFPRKRFIEKKPNQLPVNFTGLLTHFALRMHCFCISSSTA
jgi:hypothetical protein